MNTCRLALQGFGLVKGLTRRMVRVLCLLVNESLQAVQASAAHVKLEPNSKVAKRNSVFYLRQPGVTKKDFKPREVVRTLLVYIRAYVLRK